MTAEYDIYRLRRRFFDLPQEIQFSRTFADHVPYLDIVGRISCDIEGPGAGCIIADVLDCPYHAVIARFTDKPVTWSASFLGELTHVLVARD